MSWSLRILVLVITIASVAIRVKSTNKVIFSEQNNVNVCCDLGESHSEELDNSQYTVRSDYRNLEDVCFVHFWGCKLPYLPQKFLAKFSNAREIGMTFAGIKSIKSEDFRCNHNLVTLNASDNELTDLPPCLFAYTPEIENVDFSNNQISQIDANAFAVGVDCLKSINLSRNQIKSLDGRLFRNAFSLTKVDLGRNFIKYFGFTSIKLTKYTDLSAYPSSSSNCLIFPYKCEKRIELDVLTYKSINIEVDCDRSYGYILSKDEYTEPSNRVFNIDGIRLGIQY